MLRADRTHHILAEQPYPNLMLMPLHPGLAPADVPLDMPQDAPLNGVRVWAV